MASDAPWPRHLAGALRLLRPASPLVRAVLRSRAHPILSRRLLVLSYRGYRSGRAFHIPLRYAELPHGRFVVMAVRPERKLWWRSFAVPRDAVLLVRGASYPAMGAIATRELRNEARAVYAARYPGSARVLEDAALVVFERAGIIRACASTAISRPGSTCSPRPRTTRSRQPVTGG